MPGSLARCSVGSMHMAEFAILERIGVVAAVRVVDQLKRLGLQHPWRIQAEVLGDFDSQASPG